MLVFTEEEIRQHVQVNEEIIDQIESAFTDLATKEVKMPPIMRVDIDEHNGEMDVKTAYIPGLEMFALKVSTGFFDNVKLGLPSTGGLMFLIDSTNGQPVAVLHDNGYLTDVRTAAAGAVAAKYMANESIASVGVIGAGAQARYQLEALQKVRSFKEVHVFSKSENRLQEFKEAVEKNLGLSVHIEESAEAVTRKSDVLITATPSAEPLIRSDWMPKGLHITAMGSDAEHKQELAADVIVKADAVVCDVIRQCEVLGELRSTLQEKLISGTDQIMELGEVISRKIKVRKSIEAITVADLTGTGAQDTKIALYAYKKLTEEK